MPNAEEIIEAFVQGTQFDVQAYGRHHTPEETCLLINKMIMQLNFTVPPGFDKITAIKVNNLLTNVGTIAETGAQSRSSEISSVQPIVQDKPQKTRKALTDRQRSTARKLEILRILMGDPGKISLDRLMIKLERLGLATAKDRGTVVTQLSRMKEDTLLKSEQNGYYESTPEGTRYLKNYSHLRQDLMGESDEDDSEIRPVQHQPTPLEPQ